MARPDSVDSQFAEEPYLLLRALAGPRAAVRRRVPVAWRRRLGVAAGGLVGTGLRAAIVTALPVREGWPWGTFVVNVTGALLLGYLLTRFLVAAPRTTLTIPLLCIGLLGSYTTFSTFALEVARLVRVGQPAIGAAYGLVSVAVGFAVAQVGIKLAEQRP